MPSDPPPDPPAVPSAATQQEHAGGPLPDGRVEAVLLDVGGVFFLPDHAAVEGALARVGLSTQLGALDRAHYIALAQAEQDPQARMEMLGRASGAGPVPGPVRVDAVVDRYPRAYLRAIGVSEDRLDDAAAELFALGPLSVPWTRVRREAVAELRALAGTGVRLGVVSNADGTVEQTLRELGVCQVGEGPGVPVAAVVDSTVVGVAKPDPRIFEIALAAVGAPAARTVHLGDSIMADVAGALAAGIRPLHYDPLALCAGDGHRDAAALGELLPLLGGWFMGGELAPPTPPRSRSLRRTWWGAHYPSGGSSRSVTRWSPWKTRKRSKARMNQRSWVTARTVPW
jgi:putative hydrolase of the HAD superfamily